MVAIKDMEMPTDCMECMFCNHIKSNDYGTYGDCVILGDKEQIDLLLHQKHSDCPLFLLEERKVGKWVLLDKCSNSGYYCSECHKKLVKEGWSNTVKKINYCPNCGASFKEEKRGNENGSD